jgi:hypothetical protein
MCECISETQRERTEFGIKVFCAFNVPYQSSWKEYACLSSRFTWHPRRIARVWEEFREMLALAHLSLIAAL